MVIIIHFLGTTSRSNQRNCMNLQRAGDDIAFFVRSRFPETKAIKPFSRLTNLRHTICAVLYIQCKFGLVSGFVYVYVIFDSKTTEYLEFFQMRNTVSFYVVQKAGSSHNPHFSLSFFVGAGLKFHFHLCFILGAVPRGRVRIHFPPKKSTEEQSCFRQNLYPQMALYCRLWV